MRSTTTTRLRTLRAALPALALLASCSSGPSYSLVIVSASLPATDPSGRGCSTWDCRAAPESDPDPFVRGTSAAQEVGSVGTRTLTNTLNPRWGTTVIDDEDPEVLTHPIVFDVYDSDREDVTFLANADDPIAHFELALTPEQVRPGPIVLTAPVGGQTATLTLEIR